MSRAADHAAADAPAGMAGRVGLRLLLFVLLLAEGLALWRLVYAEGGWVEQAALAARIESAQRRNQLLDRRNALLHEEVLGLRAGPQAIESRARFDLGMIREDEVFVRVDD